MIKNNKKLQKEAQKNYQNLSEEEKQKRQKKARGRYRNLSAEKKEKNCQYHRDWSEEETQKKVEHMKSYYVAHKN